MILRTHCETDRAEPAGSLQCPIPSPYFPFLLGLSCWRAHRQAILALRSHAVEPCNIHDAAFFEPPRLRHGAFFDSWPTPPDPQTFTIGDAHLAGGGVGICGRCSEPSPRPSWSTTSRTTHSDVWLPARTCGWIIEALVVVAFAARQPRLPCRNCVRMRMHRGWTVQ